MRLIRYIPVFFIIPYWAAGQRMQSSGPSYTGLGAYSSRHVDVFSPRANQASLARLNRIAAGVFGERRFMLSELNSYHISIALPSRLGNFGLNAGYAGFGNYNETKAGLAYARQLGNKLDVGVQFNYNSIGIPGYGSATAITFEAGAIFHVSDKLHTGFHINNPVGGKFGKDGQEKLPSVYTMGFGFDASEIFFVGAEMIKEENQPLNVIAGLQYKMRSFFLARAGISSATSSAWIGLGLFLKSVRLDITTNYHPQLGLSPGLLIIFHLKKQEG